MTIVKLLPSPAALKQRWPSPSPLIEESRQSAQKVLSRADKRLALIVGPCSIHDPEVALDYARKLKEVMPQLERSFFPIMRLFIEKPRTLTGWKGVVYDPFLDGSNDIEKGIQMARQLWVEIAAMGIPCATELLDPLVTAYFDDLVVWGLIGARTSASQPHRQLASGLSFPVGFKNDFRGEIDVAIAGILSSQLSHSHLGLDPNGSISAVRTKGNPFTHLVLRGSEQQTNFDRASVAEALRQLELHGLKPRLLIDCSHGNSGKDFRRQKIVFESVIDQVLEGNPSIVGLMLESHLHPGKQSMSGSLRYGISVTDSCMGWEETQSLLLSAESRLQ